MCKIRKVIKLQTEVENLKVQLLESKIECLTKQLEDTEKDKNSFKNIAETNAKNNEASLNALNFVIKNYSDAPTIQVFQNFNLLFVGNEKFSLSEILCYYDKKQELPKFICDKLLPEYIKKDPSQQVVWNSDTNRLTYLLKETNKNKKGSSWNRDKEGVKLANYLVKPLLDYSKNN